MNELNNLNTERALLSAVLFEPENYELLTKLSAMDFYLPFHQHLLGVMATLVRDEKPVTEDFIRPEFKAAGLTFDEAAMSAVQGADIIPNTTPYIEQLIELSAKRGLMILSKEMINSVNTAGKSADEILDIFETRAEAIRSESTLKALNAAEWLDVYTADKYEARPKNIKPLAGTAGILFAGGIHMIYGLSKEGKTTAALEILDKVNTHRVIWLDGDNNFNDKAEAHKTIDHFRPLKPNEWIDKLIASNVDFTDFVFIIDSLKNFTGAESMDTNDGMNAILHRILDVNRLGATVVVIHHATEREGKAVLKGNKELIYSAMDVTYIFKRDKDKNKRTLYADRSRVPSVESGTVFQYDNYSMSWTTAVKLPTTSNSESKKDNQWE